VKVVGLSNWSSNGSAGHEAQYPKEGGDEAEARHVEYS
jgi:hypothetical protein